MGWKFWQKSEPEEQDVRSIENPGTPLTADSFFDDGSSESAGETVNRETALTVPAVWAAVNVLSSTIASLPLNVYRRTDDERERVSGAIQKLLHDAPNRRWTSYRWRRYMMESILLEGRSYSWIDSPSPGVVRAIWPLDPRSVTPRLDPLTQRVSYTYQPDANQPAIVYDEREILDIPWMLKSDGVNH
ncbi:MAG: phage portal protein, partial [Puniceicoccales bacterium]